MLLWKTRPSQQFRYAVLPPLNCAVARDRRGAGEGDFVRGHVSLFESRRGLAKASGSTRLICWVFWMWRMCMGRDSLRSDVKGVLMSKLLWEGLTHVRVRV